MQSLHNFLSRSQLLQTSVAQPCTYFCYTPIGRSLSSTHMFYVKSVTGKTLSFWGKPFYKIWNVKCMIQEVKGNSEEQQRLV
ncbi:hypothetical protein CROQUDRAFT_566433 [Cronartium quercuum f. sp. fusiforme G11]|uniref:Uncharacterized protein n=1 Tax=Cronartium quercuum f. sp. fusiforme G11 TaxID=708437 RepID=A0A9P6TAR8_9BASI|nr:hypothetical protein CROQUDRAFT_566433 [Cronartium quercuum f. sp. fusiforme G11]